MTVFFNDNYLQGKLLISTPELRDSCFEKSVIYVCAHNETGAMGILINQPMDDLTCGEILQQLKVNSYQTSSKKQVYFGGPVESAKGFILHTNDYKGETTQQVGNNFSITSTIDILKDIADNKGPSKSIVALGYAGWSAGQLEDEIRRNSWIVAPVDEGLIFEEDTANKWKKAAMLAGVDMLKYSSISGNA